MDTYGVKSAIDQFNEGRQFVAEQNALINQNNIKRKEDKDAKIEQDSLISDFNYAKDAITDAYAGSGVKTYYDQYQAGVKKRANIQSARQSLVGDVGDVPLTSNAPAPPTEPIPDDRPPFVSSTPPTARQSFSVAPSSRPSQPTNLRRSFAIGEQVTPQQTSISQSRASLISGGDPPVMTAQLSNDDAPTRLSSAPVGSSTNATPPPDEPEQGLTTKLIKGATGLSDETSDMIGRVGGAIAGASMGGISLYDDINNEIKTGKFFGKDSSGADDFSNVTNMIAGASDVIGLVPGLEWVAGLGNAIGGIGGVVKMFGDHAKNVAQIASDKASNIPTPTISVNPAQVAGTLEQVAQSNIRQATTTSQGY